MAYPYAIVEFPATKTGEQASCAVVPSAWLIDIGEVLEFDCFWPPFSDSRKVNKAVAEKQIPGAKWLKYQCRILKKFGEFHLSI